MNDDQKHDRYSSEAPEGRQKPQRRWTWGDEISEGEDPKGVDTELEELLAEAELRLRTGRTSAEIAELLREADARESDAEEEK